jgi:formylglycine-generating enzyme required for sulfatase activity
MLLSDPASRRLVLKGRASMADPVSVFVNHHHSPAQDSFTARLVGDLQAAGADVWVDTAGVTSNDFVRRISEGMAGRQWLVLVMTPEALASPWVQREVNAALAEHTAGRMLGVLPLMLFPCQDQDIPLLWRTLHCYDATVDYPGALAGLLRALGLPASPLSASVSPSPPSHLPSLDPAPAPKQATPVFHLTPAALYDLGFRGYTMNGVEFVLPPVCPVLSGVFMMGSDSARDMDARPNEMPQYPVQIGDFAIARYPVTVAEYACAVRSQALREPRTEPNWQKQLQHLNYPVVGQSWQEAQAYVHWLANLTGQGWRLPTEAEWEKAARGTDGRTYPWGDLFDRSKCNSSEGRRGTATPVGAYPGGSSPYLAQDMAGNVWEWVSTLKAPYPYDPTDGHEDEESLKPGALRARVLRGGSWGNDASEARTACRGGGWPDSTTFVGYYGFRLAWSESAGT